MKILKIKRIENFGIFRNFEWDNELAYLQNNKKEIYNFKKINIFYGRNYSGKTSLSKIIRSLETKNISSKYENPEFEICLEHNKTIKQSELDSFSYPIYVYNSDFVKENLKFIYDDSQDIESFSVTLGDDNQKVLNRIQALNDKLGTDKQDAETGIYLSIKEKQKNLNKATNVCSDKQKELDKLLLDRATKSEDSIRKQPEKYGDQNYTITKLKEKDIPKVLKTTYKSLDKNQRYSYEKLILQVEKEAPNKIPSFTINYQTIIKLVKEILNTQIGKSKKIEELVNNGHLNKWVEEGMHHHEKRNTCAFCSNSITNERLEALRNHFDEESTKLKKGIIKCIEYLEEEKASMTVNIDVNAFYENFHPELNELKTELSRLLQSQIQSSDMLISYLTKKQEQLFSVLEFSPPADYSEEIRKKLEQIENIRQKHIELTTNLNHQKKVAKDHLRLNNVYNFLKDINYINKLAEIEKLKATIPPLENQLELYIKEKDRILNEIKLEENKLKSEREACNRINEILQHDFGHNALSLEAKELDDSQNKIIKFEIKRNGIKAHNLSEGECSLIAFCYFLAKIQDDLEQDKNPIIWIDDPICSLDSNHIFFIFSLIQERICKNKKYKQLFISTHSLEFLKYLKQLQGIDKDSKIANKKIKEENRNSSYYLIERNDHISTIKRMPLYLSKFVTEFNFLFEKIYKCATVKSIDDSNYDLFYNFGNHARKFLEIYTFYKFPSPSYGTTQVLKSFWGDDLYVFMTDRVHNEYSHLCGVLERGELIIDAPEMKKSAIAIIKKVQEDINQYNALLESIDIEIPDDSLYPKEV
ncbi:AAA family ATPase [Gilliamella sp. Lep-s21]|uniref:AAA family ATPase n=1 Tax=unclassified Gilliamella TaxID=2685620 RepID=UPI001920A2A9